MLGEHPASTAVADTLGSFRQRLCKRLCTITITFQKVKRDTLRRLPPDSGHATQRIDQLHKQR